MKNYYWDIGEQAPIINLGLLPYGLGEVQPWYSGFRDKYWNTPTFLLSSAFIGFYIGWKLRSKIVG